MRLQAHVQICPDDRRVEKKSNITKNTKLKKYNKDDVVTDIRPLIYIVAGTDGFQNQVASCNYKPHDSEFGSLCYKTVYIAMFRKNAVE